jgi:DNA helicase IV
MTIPGILGLVGGTRPGPAPGDELGAEQEYLAHARRSLEAMRRNVAGLKAHGGDKLAREVLEANLAARLIALQDDPDVPLFFGRIDLPPHLPGRGNEVFHLGRRHVQDTEGDPVVVDWRADIARPFYRASSRDPMGVHRRRRFGFQRGELTGFEDELLGLGQELEGLSPLVAAEIERPRTGPMRDIVASIQPEQDEIVRAGLDRSVCVQGGPGTGKTAVGLHRAAYLLYAHAAQLRRAGVLVVGPNEAFIRYIGDVLPALGEIAVDQMPLSELLARPPLRVRGSDGDAAAELKHSAAMATVIRRACYLRMAAPEEPLVARVGVTSVRLTPADMAKVRRRVLQRDLPYDAGRTAFRNLLADRLLELTELSVHNVTRGDVIRALRESKSAQEVAEAAWPKIDPVDVVFRLLSDAGALAAAAEGVLSAEDQALLVWSGSSVRANAPWSQPDLLLLDEAAGVLDRPRTYGHVVVDEAQDLSPMQLRAVGRRYQRGVTLLGDLAQATTPWASSTWDEVLATMGVGKASVETLLKAFRVPGAVLAVANRLLPHIAPDLAPATAVRDTPGALSSVVVAPEAIPAEVAARVSAALGRPGSLGVIVSGDRATAVAEALDAAGVGWADVDDVGSTARVTMLRVDQAKGLEFDTVVLVEPERLTEDHRVRDLRLLYIAITRAVLRLVLVQSRPLPAYLGVPEVA